MERANNEPIYPSGKIPGLVDDLTRVEAMGHEALRIIEEQSTEESIVYGALGQQLWQMGLAMEKIATDLVIKGVQAGALSHRQAAITLGIHPHTLTRRMQGYPTRTKKF